MQWSIIIAILEIISKLLILRIVLERFPFIEPVFLGGLSVLNYLGYKQIIVLFISHSQMPIPHPSFQKGINVALN